ncbi:hypothetical protein RHSIM_Rhsim07G0102400 [Rhododendron simsii]|uniref:Cytochrome P450 n=1 Tax=Rhododendron simsii TaxID=118357 RepID=A0A834LIZ6_RHOSS|nr:hypothetical protein RHSIM_Rhsim07G0102400 [Rhododendron simsii]
MDISQFKKPDFSSIATGPLGLPIVGYLPFLGTNPHQSFTELAQQYHPIYKLRLGKKLCVVLNSPSLAKEVVRDQDGIVGNLNGLGVISSQIHCGGFSPLQYGGYSPIHCCHSIPYSRGCTILEGFYRNPPIAALAYTYSGFDIAWAPYGSYWRTLPKVFVREMLSNTSLEDTYSLRREEVRKTIRDLHNRIGMGVDIGETSFLTAFNVVMSMLWGGTVDRRRAESVGTEFQAAMLRIVDLLGKPNVSDFFPILARFDL